MMRNSLHIRPPVWTSKPIPRTVGQGAKSVALVIATVALILSSGSRSLAQCTTGGCSDYSSILSNACENCASNCGSLSLAGTGCGGPISCGGRPNLLDFVFGDSCACGGCGDGCVGCVGSGCGGNYWNDVCSGPGCGDGLLTGLTTLLFGSPASGCGDNGGCENNGGDASDGGAIGLSGGGLRGCGPGGCLTGGCGLLGGCGAGCGDGSPGAGYIGEREAPIFCGMPAPSYPVPHAVPANVGYTQLTYPPFMPHHSLPHYRTTYSYRHAPGMSRTTVHWRSTVGRDILARLHNMIELPR